MKDRLSFYFFASIVIVIFVLLQLNIEIGIIGAFGTIMAVTLLFCTSIILELIKCRDYNKVHSNFRISIGGIIVILVVLQYALFKENQVLGIYLSLLIIVSLICTSIVLKKIAIILNSKTTEIVTDKDADIKNDE